MESNPGVRSRRRELATCVAKMAAHVDSLLHQAREQGNTAGSTSSPSSPLPLLVHDDTDRDFVTDRSPG